MRDPMAASRPLVTARSRGMCEWCCVRPAAHMHHRQLRRHGDHSPANLLHLCAGCHEGIHRNVAEARRVGAIVPGSAVATEVRFWHPCTRRWVLLDSEGGTLACATSTTTTS